MIVCSAVTVSKSLSALSLSFLSNSVFSSRSCCLLTSSKSQSDPVLFPLFLRRRPFRCLSLMLLMEHCVAAQVIMISIRLHSRSTGKSVNHSDTCACVCVWSIVHLGIRECLRALMFAVLSWEYENFKFPMSHVSKQWHTLASLWNGF